MEKGDYQGECFRTACSNPNAIFYNKGTQKYYCSHCAKKINEYSGVEVCMTKKTSQLYQLKDLLNEQLSFMVECGGDLEGYKKKYGNDDNGGTNIYLADKEELERIQKKIKELEE